MIKNTEMHQYFIKDKSTIEREIELANLHKDDIVLEIGAGSGNLTKYISKKCKVIAVEKDERMKKFLELENVSIVIVDALDYLSKPQHKFNKIISNIPYYISQSIILKLLELDWEICVLIVQKEFAEKLLGKTKLSMVVGSCAQVCVEDFVPASFFDPEGIDSNIIVIRKTGDFDSGFWNFLKMLKMNKNVGSQISCSKVIKLKKIHQLTLKELKELYEINKKNSYN